MKKNYALLLALSSVCFSNSVQASGWATDDYSVTGLGRTYSDGGLVGDDYSALAYNPAAMTLGQSGIQAGASYIHEHSDVNGMSIGNVATGKPGNIPLRSTMEARVAIPNFFAQYKLNDTLTIGTGIYVPFGLASQYRPNWGADDHGIKANVRIIDYALGLGMKATEKLSLGYTLIARHETMSVTSYSYIPQRYTALYTSMGKNLSGFNQFTASDWSVGHNFGVMYQATDKTRFGIAYRTRTQHQGKGGSTIGLKCFNGDLQYCDFESTISMNTPEHVLFNIYHQLDDKLGLSFGAKWTRWSRFGSLEFHSKNILDTSSRTNYFLTETAQRWKNVWKFAIGADYKYNENWTFRSGFGYDRTPVPNSYSRIASLPDNDRFNMSIGLTYKTGNWSYDVGYMFMYFKSFQVLNNRHNSYQEAQTSQLNAKYNMTVHVVGIQAKYDF